MGQAAVSFLLCEITEQQNVSGSAPLLKTRLNKAEGDTHRREDSGKGKEGGAGDLEDFLGSVGIYSVLRIELAKCLTGAELQPCPVSTTASLQQGQNELSAAGCIITSRDLQNVLAKALYDNVAESPDELSFRKGDIMTVLERDTQGLDGWWLCSLHGRQGIVPGNRLKLLVGMYDSKQQQAMPSTPEPASCPSSIQRPLPPLSAYAKPSPATSSATCSSGYPIKPLPSTQYTSMHPAYSSPAQPNLDSVYMMPPSHGPKPSPQSVYQIPSGPSGLPPGPPSKTSLAQRQYHSPGQDIYQVPPSLGPGPGHTGGTGAGQDVYQ
ncbi:hypothetical protein JOQ06_002833, partial [Pogonophryne albipinna]